MRCAVRTVAPSSVTDGDNAFVPALWPAIVSGAVAGFAELTLGGNPLSVFIANQIAGNPDQVRASLKKGWLSHYYGQSYVVNVAFRLPFVSAITTGVSLANAQLSSWSPMSLPFQIGFQSMTAASLALPFVGINDWFLANRANNNRDLKSMQKAGFGPLTASFRRSMYATWCREALFISGPICSAGHLRDWLWPQVEHDPYVTAMQKTYLASVVTGVPAALASHPFHVVAITQQSEGHPKGVFETARIVFHAKGLGHLLSAGLLPRIARIGLCSGMIVITVESVNDAIKKRFYDN